MTELSGQVSAFRADRDRQVTGAIDATAVARRYTGAVGWPTVALCLTLTCTYVLVIIGWAFGVVPLWAGCAVNSVVTYAFYTVHHDANHKSISGRNAKWRWRDRVCGEIAAVPLQINFLGFSAEHLRHHSHTNDPLHDPDVLVAGPMWALPIKWLLVLLASIPLGVFMPMFFLWWLPGRFAVLALMVLFQWLPHVPYESTDRYENTRVTTFRGSTWLLLQQDRHLIHHLYPSVPWYRYRAVFREIRPLLEAEGARIEGRDSASRRPIQLRFHRSAKPAA